MACKKPGCKAVHRYTAPPSTLNNSCYNPADHKTSEASDADTKDVNISVSPKKTLKSKKKGKLNKVVSPSSSTTTTSLDSENSGTAGSTSSAGVAGSTSSADSADSDSTGSVESSASSSNDSSTSSSVDSSTSSSKDNSTSSSSEDDVSSQKAEAISLAEAQKNPVEIKAKATKTPTLIINGTGTGADRTNYKLDDSVCTDVNCTGCSSDHNSTVRNVFFGVAGALVVLMISYLFYIKYKTKGKAKKSTDYKELSGEVKI